MIVLGGAQMRREVMVEKKGLAGLRWVAVYSSCDFVWF